MTTPYNYGQPGDRAWHPWRYPPTPAPSVVPGGSDPWLDEEIIIHDRGLRVAGSDSPAAPDGESPTTWKTWALTLGLTVVLGYWLWPVAIGAYVAHKSHWNEALKW